MEKWCSNPAYLQGCVSGGARGTCIFISSSMSFLCRSPCAAAPPSSVTLQRLLRTRKTCSGFHAGKMDASLSNIYIYNMLHHCHVYTYVYYIYIIDDTYNLTLFSKVACCFFVFASKTLTETCKQPHCKLVK